MEDKVSTKSIMTILILKITQGLEIKNTTKNYQILGALPTPWILSKAKGQKGLFQSVTNPKKQLKLQNQSLLYIR